MRFISYDLRVTSAFPNLIIFHLERIVVWFQGECQLLGPSLSTAASWFLFAACAPLVGSIEKGIPHIVLPIGPAVDQINNTIRDWKLSALLSFQILHGFAFEGCQENCRKRGQNVWQP